MSTAIKKSPQERIQSAIGYGNNLLNTLPAEPTEEQINTLRKYAINAYILTQDLGIEDTALTEVIKQAETRISAESNIVVRAKDEFENAGVILRNNKLLADKHTQYGVYLIRKVEEDNGGVVTAEMDKKLEAYMVASARILDTMNDGRKVFTQTLTLISKAFTSEEARLDKKNAASEPYKIQQFRNERATQLAKEAAERESRIKKEQAIEAEKVRLKAENKVRLINFVGEQIKAAIIALENRFNKITLEDFDTVSDGLRKFIPPYPYSNYEAYRHGLYSTLITDADVNALLQPEIQSMYKDSEKRFVDAVTESKNYLVDTLASKKQQLIDIKEMADEAEAERQKEEQLKLELEKADAAKKEQLQKELDAATKLREEAEAAANELAAEKKRIENEEREKSQSAADAASAAATDLVFAESNAEQTTLFFEAEHKVSVANAGIETPQTRSGYEIEALTPVAYMSMFTQWFNLKGGTMTIDELDKKLDFIRKFCEKEAFKDESKKLQTSTLRYKPVYTAVNNAKKK